MKYAFASLDEIPSIDDRGRALLANMIFSIFFCPKRSEQKASVIHFARIEIIFSIFLFFFWKQVLCLDLVLPIPSEEHSGGAVYQTNNVCGLAKVQTHSALVCSLCFFITSGSVIILSAIHYPE